MKKVTANSLQFGASMLELGHVHIKHSHVACT